MAPVTVCCGACSRDCGIGCCAAGVTETGGSASGATTATGAVWTGGVRTTGGFSARSTAIGSRVTVTVAAPRLVPFLSGALDATMSAPVLQEPS